MKKIILLTLIICSFSTITFAQNKKQKNVKVTGKIIDKESKTPLEYATIVFKNLKNNQITGGITNTEGDFDIMVPIGNYDIDLEFISYKTHTIKNKKLTDNLNLGIISLSEEGEVLDEINIIAEKSTVEIKLDKKIYNVGKDMTVKGGSVADVLDNIPSVAVDVEGSVSLRGNENVRILIDGKPSALVGINGTDALRQLPAESIEKVEVITSPSARYEAEGTAGILNIILRKGKITGFNGSLTTTVGTPDQYGIAANINYRTKKINLFTNLGYQYSNSPGNSNNHITYLNDDKTIRSYRTEDRLYERLRNSFNSTIGLEYFLNDKSSLTGTFSYRNSDGNDLSTNLATNFSIDNQKTFQNNRIEDENEKNTTFQYSLNYTYNINKSGQKLTFDAQYSDSKEDSFAEINDSDVFPTAQNNTPEDNSTNEQSKNILIKADYVLPIGENSQFEVGFKSDLQHLTSDYVVNDPDLPQEFNPSNNLDFKQNIHAFYTQYGHKTGKFSYLLGIRYEFSDFEIYLKDSERNHDKSYGKFFPTLNLGYEFNDSESITLGYNRRLRRPRHWFLNPFISRTSETFIFTGNVDLDPTFTNALELTYLKKWSGFTLNSSIYYQQSINNIEFVTRETGDLVNGIPVILRSPINLSTEDRYGFELTSNYNPTKAISLSGSFNFYNFTTTGTYQYTNSNNEEINTNFDNESTSWFARFNAKVKLPAKIQWQTGVMYRGPQKNAQSERKGMFFTTMAFSKDVFKEKGTLVLNVRDLFNSAKRNSTNYSERSITEGEFQYRQRQISLSFTYRFNQKKNQRPKKRSQEFDGGGEEDFGK